MITPRPRLGGGDSRSTSRLHSSSAHRSMTRLNLANLLPNTPSGSGSGLHKSMTRLPLINSSVTTITRSSDQPRSKISSGGVTVTTNHSPTTSVGMRERDESSGTLSNGPPLTSANSGTFQQLKHSSSPLTQSLLSTTQPSSSNLNSMLVSSSGVSVSQTAPSLSMSSSQALVTPRRSNTSVTIINHNSNAAIVAASQRISVFEPYPMRDTIQHFCEKHLDKIKTYMENVSERIPLPAKCTIEENTRAKKMAKLQFGCDGRGEHCLYSRTLFTMRSRNPRVWIHFMFLSLQAKSQSALSSRHPAVTALKYCWDILKCENKPFVTLVTSAFPCARDQEAVVNELRAAGFCDVFEYQRHEPDGRGLWGCFLCNHPERAVGFLHDSQPVIEGQLKEKKGRWRMFRRWRTRYFTLSGARLEYKGTDDKDARPIDIHQIRSVKVSRGARNIPKAFEIFTGDNSLILKPKDGKNAEEWVQCLSVVVAHSQAKEVPTRGSSLVRTPV
uniref:Protein melted n=1 Tax=Lygus hesperus TaxID=30085 RepID=A0A0A9WRW1_LYGHE